MTPLRVGWWTAFLGIFLLPYAQVSWWSFPLSTGALLVLALIRWRREALARLGLPTRAATVVACLGAFAVLAFLLRQGMEVFSYPYVLLPWPLARVAVFPFQALNEEIVLGFLLLTALVRRGARPVLAALGVAVVFGLLHFALYRFGTFGRSLEGTTLATLVAVGALRNALILLPGHVGYAWALHAAWNVSMFGGVWIWSDSAGGGSPLSEPEVLDLHLGSPGMVAVTVIAAGITLLALGRRDPSSDASVGL